MTGHKIIGHKIIGRKIVFGDKYIMYYNINLVKMEYKSKR